MANGGSRRMTLRQLLTHTDKCVRELQEAINADMMRRLAEFRDLSRPVRRRSHYPTMLAVHNALRRLLESSQKTQGLTQQLEEFLVEVRNHAKRELANRI